MENLWKDSDAKAPRDSGARIDAKSTPPGTPTDEIDLECGVAVETRLNGEFRQYGHTRDLIFPVDALLRYITAAMTLYPGDLIPTGTPAGVGPMQRGDRVEVVIEGIGTLGNPVA